MTAAFRLLTMEFHFIYFFFCPNHFKKMYEKSAQKFQYEKSY